MSRNATVARLRDLKEEYGATSEEAYEVIKQDRIHERIAQEAAKIANLPVVPTGSFVAKICCDIGRYLSIFGLFLEDLFKAKKGWLIRGDVLWFSDHFNSYPPLFSVDYPKAVGSVCATLQQPFQAQSDTAIKLRIYRVAGSSRIIRPPKEKTLISGNELVSWLSEHPRLFKTPGSSRYESRLRVELESLNSSGEDRFLSGQETQEELRKIYQAFYDSRLKAWRDEIILHTRTPLPQINPSLGTIFEGRKLYERAKRELTLGYLWVQRRIALASVMNYTEGRYSRISATILGRILEHIQDLLRRELERREMMVTRNFALGLTHLDPLIEKHRYEWQVIMEHSRWLLRVLNS